MLCRGELISFWGFPSLPEILSLHLKNVIYLFKEIASFIVGMLCYDFVPHVCSPVTYFLRLHDNFLRITCRIFRHKFIFHGKSSRAPIIKVFFFRESSPDVWPKSLRQIDCIIRFSSFFFFVKLFFPDTGYTCEKKSLKVTTQNQGSL